MSESISKSCPNCKATVSSSATDCHSCKAAFGKQNAKPKSNTSLPVLILICFAFGFAGFYFLYLAPTILKEQMAQEQAARQAVMAREQEAARLAAYAEYTRRVEEARRRAEINRPGLSLRRAMGNIAPYRRDMLYRIAQNWHPKFKNENLILQIVIGKDGQLLSAEIIESSGRRKGDKEAIAAVEATEFAPLPEWYRGEQLTFKIAMEKVEAMRRNRREMESNHHNNVQSVVSCR